MKNLICIVCPNGCRLHVAEDGTVSGQGCKRGVAFAQQELQAPMRSLTTTVKTKLAQCPVLAVRTDGEIPKGLIFDAVQALAAVVVEQPLAAGDVVVQDLLGTGCRVIATENVA